MKKALTIALLLTVSVLFTGCVKKSAEEKVEEEIFSGSLFDLVKVGKTAKCTFSTSDENGSSEGTIYVSEKKARNDFSGKTAEGDSFESHMITDDEYIYMWTSISEQGTKMKLSDVETQQQNISSSEDMKEAYQGYKDLQNNIDFKCMPWIPDGSKFDPPSDIEFIDITRMMEQIQEQTTQIQQGSQDMCGMCDMMPSAQEKTDCLASLGCE